MKCFCRIIFACLGLLACFSFVGCSVNRFIPEDEYMLNQVSIHSDKKELKTAPLMGYVGQHPNNKWFSLVKVPLYIYSLSGRDSTKRINRFIRRLGEPPVIYDSTLSQKTRLNIQNAVQNMGYLNAEVELLKISEGNRIGVQYYIKPHQRYRVRQFQQEIRDTAIAQQLKDKGNVSLLQDNMYFDLNVLESERNRLNTFLQNKGYYKFNKDFVRFEADTTLGNHLVDLKMILQEYSAGKTGEVRPHQRYTIGNVSYNIPLSHNKPFVRPKVIASANELTEGALYREQDVQGSYSRLNRLGAVQSGRINFTENAEDSTKLDAQIIVTPSKRNSFNIELEGTNSAGDLGVAVAFSYQNRNIFRGSELLNLKARGAFEAIKGLRDYSDQNFIEYSFEAGITFPDFICPFLRHSFRKHVLATSELSFMFDSQDRPEFHRRVLTTSWRYKWSRAARRMQHRIDLLDINYVFMPWISDTFRERYLENPESRNAILRYNYENLFIVKWGYSFFYSSQSLNPNSKNYGTNAYIIRASIETAGNLLYGIFNMSKASRNTDGQYTLFNNAFAQYVKGDIDFSKSFMINKANSLALHFGLGIAYPYGNSTILPYEKRYFSGGANSVRGWSVRELGPGSFLGNDGKIDFINQTGDLKLDMNVEYRTHLFWKFDAAAFIDAGNIWTLRDYPDQPGGQFRFDTFWRQIAVAYGLGLRLNFNYFILRLDGGMKAVHPSYEDSYRHFPIIHPNFKRDFSFHFAVGLPF
ncbi:MAG: BamA/TamA family outer membrane protein [Bacteroidaceae bacterium]|nr:BamA/TamA family outer membrane protein [Bacteroidaceae bacterium]